MDRYDAAVVRERMTKAEQAETTRQALIDAGRSLFAAKGYAKVGTEEIVRTAKVTRGALYHHFEDKKDLFRAVYEQVEEETVAAVATKMRDIADASELLETGVVAYLDACRDPELARIALIEAPAVLGRAEWLEIGSRYGFGLVTGGLQHAVNSGLIRRQPVEPLARLLFAAMAEAGSEIAANPGDETRHGQIQDAVLELIRGLRVSD